MRIISSKYTYKKTGSYAKLGALKKALQLRDLLEGLGELRKAIRLPITVHYMKAQR